MHLKIRKSTSLEEIIKGCEKNNPRSQRELFVRYSPRMLGICRRYISNLVDAEDIMIEGFMKILENINQFKGSGSFEGWMIRIMVNESLSFIRRNKNMSVEVSLEKAEPKPDYSFVYSNFNNDQLLKLIDDMPVGYQTVFNLYVMEGYTHKEIGALLNITEGASKSQLSRAKAYLRQRFLIFQQELKKRSHEK